MLLHFQPTFLWLIAIATLHNATGQDAELQKDTSDLTAFSDHTQHVHRLERQAAPANTQQQNDTGCCHGLTLKPGGSLDATLFMKCQKNCIYGIYIESVDCLSTSAPVGTTDWAALIPILNQFTSVNGSFVLSDVKCDFAFSNLVVIRGDVAKVESVDGSSRSFSKLLSVEPARPDCYLEASITNFTPGQGPVDKFNKAIENGNSSCVLPKITTPSPQQQQKQSAGNGQSNAQSSQSCPTTDGIYKIVSIVLGSLFGVFILTLIGGGITVYFVWDMKTQHAIKSIKYFVEDAMHKGILGLDEEHINAELAPEKETEFEQPSNHPKVKCVEKTRVRLEGASDGDFIDANYVGVPGHSKRFIATPIPSNISTFNFWHMCIQEGCRHIIMIVDIPELVLDFAEKPDPNNMKRVYEHCPRKKKETLTFYATGKPDEIAEVTCVGTSVYKKNKWLEIRKISIVAKRSGVNPEKQKITVWHWIKWPDTSTPFLFDETLCELYRITFKNKHPVVVQCSNGIGRTGAVILVAYMFIRIRRHEQVETAIEILKKLRRCRSRLVKCPEQYIFALQVILYNHRLYCGLNGLESKHETFTSSYHCYMCDPADYRTYYAQLKTEAALTTGRDVSSSNKNSTDVTAK